MREEAFDAAAICFLVIHRGIGGADERPRIPAIRRVRAYTDAAADMKRMLLDLKRRRQALHYLLRYYLGIFLFRDVRQADHELVAAEPRSGIAFAHAGVTSHRHGLQQLIANVMAERILDVQSGRAPGRARGGVYG